MMNKRWPALLLCLIVLTAALLTGCDSNGIIVGKVGRDTITVKEVKMYAGYLLLQNGYTLADITDASMAKSVNQTAVNTAVLYKLILLKGKEQKLYPLSDANRKDVDTMVTSFIDSIKQQVQQQAAYSGSSVTDNQAEAAVDTQLKAVGLTRADVTEIMTQSKVDSLLMEEAVKGVTVTDDEVKAEYDKLVAEQKESYTKDASAYETAKSDGSTIIVYKPEGYRYIKHILITFPDDIASQITTAQSSSDTETIKTLREQGLKQIQAKADEVLAKVKAGGDFDALMKEYGQDPGMKSDPDMTTGYEVGNATNFMQEFKDAALKLANVGDTTDLVATDYGYHIIKWVGNVPSGPVAYDSVKDAVSKQVLTTKQNDEWNKIVDQWKAAAQIETNVDKIPIAVSTAAAAQ